MCNPLFVGTWFFIKFGGELILSNMDSNWEFGFPELDWPSLDFIKLKFFFGCVWFIFEVWLLVDSSEKISTSSFGWDKLLAKLLSCVDFFINEKDLDVGIIFPVSWLEKGTSLIFWLHEFELLSSKKLKRLDLFCVLVKLFPLLMVLVFNSS